ncbi:MAG: TlpA family protein disulfide reductase, partial [Betaproteobacteria bacterium]|nr:TlpA family protein disulfide reductase [Betaproteobacteria bacterium]
LGYAVAVFVAGAAQRKGQGHAEPALLPLLVLALVVARAVFVAQHLASYPTMLSMLDIRDRGFAPVAGWVAAVLGVAFWAWRRPALRRSLPMSAAIGAAAVLAAGALLQAVQPPRPPLPQLSLQRLGGEEGNAPEGAALALSRPGGEVALRSLKGKPLVLNLWATWCPPCRRELPTLVQAARQEHKVRIVLVNEGESAQRVADFLRREKLAPPEVLLDPGSRLLSDYQSPGLPTTLFIAADGKVRRMHLGELSAATLQQGIAELGGS